MLDTQLTSSLSYKLFRADQVRENEAEAAAQSGCDMFTLMQRAGGAVSVSYTHLTLPTTPYV